ncbi:hypothetical protein LRD18_12295 [Halorhodospira halochloris]|uniref:transposase n=1 Tax=Halorhodospira halochloris TaxID=1052 RepID=UPI001EE7B41D|nr:transposase [Halorhodospira halochloris]MCG5531619.1 hypothetical protein [Halorhodospira halochloris]
MPRPRCDQISLSSTPFYHVVSRCVRRSYLCGQDYVTGKCYKHRQQFIEERIRLLSSIFAVEIVTYAIMANHYHIVVKIDQDQANSWSNEDVIKRWRCLFKGPLLVQRYLAKKQLDELETAQVAELAGCYRERLGSLSWFMKCLNEPIARKANKEDQCSGHFWESRFKSQALLNDAALLSCMAYVDLNPVRANAASTPESSEHTGLRERLEPRFNLQQAVREQLDTGSLLRFEVPLKPLLKFKSSTVEAANRDNCDTIEHSRIAKPNPVSRGLATDQDALQKDYKLGIPCSFDDYLKLVDFSGRAIRPHKKGALAHSLPPILQRLGIADKQWLEQATRFECLYRRRQVGAMTTAQTELVNHQ